MKLNLVMIVKNEEWSLGRCLQSAKPLVDDIIIADTGSTDRTREIAMSMGAKVWDFPWVNDFSAARNFALDHSESDWNLVLDGDEYLRPCSRADLENIINQHKGRWLGAIVRYDAFVEGEGIGCSTSLLPRLLPKGVGYAGIIHEQPDCDLPCIPVSLEADHDGYLNGGKGERNLPYLIKAAEENPQDGYYQFQLASTLRNLGRLEESLSPFRAFYRYGDRKGAYWAGGVVLYLYTLLDLGGSGKLLEAKKVVEAERGSLERLADFSFVCGLFFMKLVLSDPKQYIEYLPEIEGSYLRCLTIGERPQDGGVVGTGSFKAAYNLGLWYEVSGQREKALQYYGMAADLGFAPAGERLFLIK
ncbi:MAG: glycosyltransferase family 2 protein [Clostridium sp.]|nr:glycosyltransferase family 2 protein [Clostridium sp.]